VAEEAKQTVDDQSDDAAQQATDDAAARDEGKTEAAGDELEKLLAEFDSKDAGGSEVKPEPEPDNGSSDLKKRLEALEARDTEAANRQFEADMKSAVDKVRGEMPSDKFTDGMVRGWLDERAVEDERLKRAWVNRHASPAAFERVLAELGRNFAKNFSSDVDAGATEDRDAVAAAVRGASTTPPDGQAPSFAGKTNQEFADEVEKKYGFRPGV